MTRDRAPDQPAGRRRAEPRAVARRHGAADEELSRLRSVEVALDQCWDLLCQRRARRAAGRDPEDAEVRPEGVVEGYKQ